MWTKWGHNLCRLRGPRAQHGDKIRTGYLTPAVSGAHIWAKWLHITRRLGGPSSTAGTNLEVAT